MPFGVMSGVGRGMGVLHGGGYRRREGVATVMHRMSTKFGVDS